MGGFTSTAPILAGRLRGILTFIHESNAIPGKANKLTARMAVRFCLVLRNARHFFRGVADRSHRHADPNRA